MPIPKILHIDTGRTFRGGQRQVALLTERLQWQGIEQVVACPGHSGLIRLLASIPTVELSTYSLVRKLHLRPLRDAILARGLTIVHAHDSEAHTLGMLLKIAIPPLKLVVTRRVVFPPSGFISAWFKYRRRVDQFIAVSAAVADSLVKAGVDRGHIVIVPDGIDLQAVGNAPRGGAQIDAIAAKYKFLVVTAGALTGEKDFPTAIEAMRAVHEKIPGAALVILGEGPERETLARQIAEHHLDYVFLMGHVELIAPIFKACHLFLLTSACEGLNTSAIEAAACGLPLVVSNIGGLPEVAEDGFNGVLCPVGRPESYAAAVCDLLEHEEKRKRMGANSIERACRFDIEKVIPEIVDLYKRVLGT
jgi:glycosyltransferase involved in cell wall biosynthesis